MSSWKGSTEITTSSGSLLSERPVSPVQSTPGMWGLEDSSSERAEGKERVVKMIFGSSASSATLPRQRAGMTSVGVCQNELQKGFGRVGEVTKRV